MQEASLFTLTEKENNLRKLIGDIRQELKGTAFEKATDSLLEQAEQSLQDKNFVLAFVGDWNTGKSSLINRLLFNDDVLPVGDDPTTSRITLIRHGKVPRLRRWWVSRRQEEELAKGAQEVKEALTRHAVAGANETASPADNYELILDWDAEILKTGLIVVDTPGLADPERLRSLVTEKYMQIVDGVIVVTDPFQAMTRHLSDFLSRNVFRRHMKKFFFLMNKADRVPPDDPEPVLERLGLLQDDIRKTVKEALETFQREFARSAEINFQETAPDRYFAVSAKTGEGLSSFLERLKSFAETEKFDAVVQAAGQKIQAAMEILKQRIEAEEAAVGTDIQKWDRELEKHKKQKQLLENQAAQRMEAFHVKLAELEEYIHKALSKIYDEEVMEAERFRQNEARFLTNVFPRDFVKKLGTFVDNQKFRLERKLEEVDKEIRFNLTMALADLSNDIQRMVREITGIKSAPEPKIDITLEDIKTFTISAEAKVLIRSMLVGAASGGLAVALGAATEVTQTVVSTLPTWFPSWIVTKTTALGIATTVSQSTAIAWGSALSYALLPASVYLLSANLYLLYRQRQKIAEEFDNYIESLKIMRDNLIREAKEYLRNNYLAFREGVTKGIEAALNNLEAQIADCRSAAAARRISPESERIMTKLPDWERRIVN